ncbi:MAG: phage tail tube protein [Actinomycetota bacterium]
MPNGPYTTSDSRNYLGFGKEVTKATPVAPTVWAAFVGDATIDHKLDIKGLKEAGGSGAITLSEKMAEDPTGTFSLRGRPSPMGQFAAWLLGADSVGAAVSGVYPHTITPDLVTDYLTVETNLADDGIERIADCVISEMVYEVSNSDSQILKANGTWMGGTPAWQASATAESYDAGTPFVLGDGTFTIDGGVAANVQKLTLNCQMRYDAEKISDVVPLYLIKLGLDVTGTIEQLMLDVNAEYRKVLYGSTGGTTYQRNPQSTALTADFQYGAAGTLREFKLNVPTIDFTDAKYTPLNADGSAAHVMRSFQGRVAGGSPLITITAKTTDSAAYV